LPIFNDFTFGPSKSKKDRKSKDVLETKKSNLKDKTKNKGAGAVEKATTFQLHTNATPFQPAGGSGAPALVPIDNQRKRKGTPLNFFTIKRGGLNKPLKAKAIFPTIKDGTATIQNGMTTFNVLTVEYQKITGANFAKAAPRRLLVHNDKEGLVRVLLTRNYADGQFATFKHEFNSVADTNPKVHNRYLSVIDKVKSGDVVGFGPGEKTTQKIQLPIYGIKVKGQNTVPPQSLVQTGATLIILPSFMNDNTYRGIILVPGSLAKEFTFMVCVVSTTHGVVPVAGTFWHYPAIGFNGAVEPYPVPNPFDDSDATSVTSRDGEVSGSEDQMAA